MTRKITEINAEMLTAPSSVLQTIFNSTRLTDVPSTTVGEQDTVNPMFI